MRLAARLALVGAVGTILSAACHDDAAKPGAADGASGRTWELLASELPSALLSVSGRSASDVLAVGADKGHGPLVLHFDGKKWSELHTGTTGDLWWVQALPNGPALMGGARGTVLRYDGKTFERLATPGFARQIVYGVWGTSGDDFYAVGSASGRSGFLWHYHAGKFESETLPADYPKLASGDVPGLYKVWGAGDDVWVVGSGGAIMHRKGSAPFAMVPSPTKSTLFTVHGTGDRLVVVGGSGNGVVLTGGKESFRDVSPAGAGLIQGIFTTDKGDWASGERGVVYQREKPDGAFAAIDHGLQLPAASSLHSIFVDPGGGVWSAGGNVLTPALDNGMLIHYGEHVEPVIIAEEEETDGGDADAGAPACPADVIAAGKTGSVARRWDEQALAAIRRASPRPTVHARNLFHMSAAMWDAWAAYDPKASGFYVSERHTDADLDKARRTAISYAAHAVLAQRYKRGAGSALTLACLRAVMTDLGLDANDTHDTGDDPVAFGNRVGHKVIATALEDGANEAQDYLDGSFMPVNAPLAWDGSGTTTKDPMAWQPIALANGTQTFTAARWGGVAPFAMKKDGKLATWPDPGAAPKPGAELKAFVVEVIQKEAAFDPADAAALDISPAARGHNALGANDGKGWPKNPVTGEAYAAQTASRADYGRVVAELWTGGPRSETPPGHWNVLANQVSDHAAFKHTLFGKGAPLDPLAWDVRMYFALNGAEHDAAIAAWGIKRQTVTARPLSLVRFMGGKGQSSDPKGPAFDPDGLPLVPGLVEVITKESSAPGERHAQLALFVGQVAVRGWLGEPGDHATQVGGVGWLRAVDWIPYQKRTVVTPPAPAFVSGTSTFARAAAEVLAGLTGSAYFPSGLGEFVASKDTFLANEKGPSTAIRLQWASYFDAADEAGQSGVWGSVQLTPDDLAGRRVGASLGRAALVRATKYFDGQKP